MSTTILRAQAPFLPESWWAYRDAQIASGWSSWRSPGLFVEAISSSAGVSGRRQWHAGGGGDTTPRAPVARHAERHGPDTDPSQHVASMSPQRVETFNLDRQAQSRAGDWSADTGNQASTAGPSTRSPTPWGARGGSGNRPTPARRADHVGSLLQSHQGWVACLGAPPSSAWT